MAKSAKNKKGKASSRMLMVGALFMAIIFLPSTLLLVIGMLPTFIAFLSDRNKRRSKTTGIGAMNLAGCMPFLIELWMNGNNFEKSVSIIMDPKAISVMYAGAGLGYMINWAMTGITAAILYERGVARGKAVAKHKQDLENRWGPEVTGKMALDSDGFAIDRPVEEGKADG